MPSLRSKQKGRGEKTKQKNQKNQKTKNTKFLVFCKKIWINRPVQDLLVRVASAVVYAQLLPLRRQRPIVQFA